MARHSNGKNTFAVAGWVVLAAAICVIAVAAALAIWLLNRDESPQEAASASPAEVTSDHQTAASTTVAGSTTAHVSAASATAGAADSTTVSSSASTAAAATTTPAESPAAADTLILLDTSEAMAADYVAVADILAQTAQGLAADAKSVALWNYSSPLSATATVGYRDNLGFGPGEKVAASVKQFGTGGVAQTRSAAIAALATASEQAKLSGTARVLLVTSGTEQDMDDESFTAAINQAKGPGVDLSVVHVGNGEPDKALVAVADHYSTATTGADGATEKAIQAAAGLSAAE